MNHVWRLIREELKPYTKGIILRILLAAIISATPYAFSFLGKWLVDGVLQVSGPPKAAVEAPAAVANGETTGASTDSEAAASGVQVAGVTVQWTENSSSEKLRMLLIFVAVTMGMHILTTGLGAWSELLNSRTVQTMVYGLRTRVHERLANADSRYLASEQTGQFMSRVLDDCGNVPPNLINLVVNFCTQVMMLILGLVLLIRLNPAMSLVAAAVLPFYAVTCIYFLPRLRRNTEDLRHNAARMTGHAIERLSNVMTIKNYAQEDAECQRYGAIVDQQSTMARHQHRLNLGFNSLTTLITGFATLGVLGFGFLHIKDGSMQLGEVLAFYQVTAQLFVPISALVGMASVAQTIQILAERVHAVLDAPVAIESPDDAVAVETVRGEIVYEGVSMRYMEGGPFAVEDVNLRIPAGATVCIVGPTGCGKSTLLHLLTRIYDPDLGSISIDGVDIRQWPLRRLRRSIGNVLRDTDLFTGTIAENIAYGAPKADEARIITAAKTVGLHEHVVAMPKGYKTPLGSGGETLASDDLLRLSLARALIINPAILIVDDTFASVEESLEESLRRTLETALADKTIIIATSRLSICEDADLIVVQQRGAIVQTGTHAELMAVPGLYRRMYRRQMGLSEKH